MSCLVLWWPCPPYPYPYPPPVRNILDLWVSFILCALFSSQVCNNSSIPNSRETEQVTQVSYVQTDIKSRTSQPTNGIGNAPPTPPTTPHAQNGQINGHKINGQINEHHLNHLNGFSNKQLTEPTITETATPTATPTPTATATRAEATATRTPTISTSSSNGAAYLPKYVEKSFR